VFDGFLAGLAKTLAVVVLPVPCLVPDHHVADHHTFKSFSKALGRELPRNHAGQLHVDHACFPQVRPPPCNPSKQGRGPAMPYPAAAMRHSC
jgi:hypothetical protein